MMIRRIGVITGARSEFGILLPIIKEIKKSSKLELQLFVTGMHLLPDYGNTIEEIRNKGFRDLHIIPMYQIEELIDKKKFVAKGISKAILEFTNQLIEQKTDIILVLGDRSEILAACISAATLNLPIVHIHGGDISENAQIDEQIRHAITKFAHLHFPATELSKRRILQMGEQKWRVILSGSPSIDYIKQINLFSKEELLKKLDLSKTIQLNQDIVLCLEHPEIFNKNKMGRFMNQILISLKKLNKHIFVIYPNNDPGNELIINEIQKFESNPYFHVYRNLNRKLFLSLMKHSVFMIGNSSSALIEPASFHVPAINVGIRNNKRESSKNVIHVKNDLKCIDSAIKTVLSPSFRRKCKEIINIYGDGNASKIIAKKLENVEIDYNLMNKKFEMINI